MDNSYTLDDIRIDNDLGGANGSRGDIYYKETNPTPTPTGNGMSTNVSLENGTPNPNDPLSMLKMANKGNGAGVYDSRVGNSFLFKSIKGGPGIELSIDQDSIIIRTAGGEGGDFFALANVPDPTGHGGQVLALSDDATTLQWITPEGASAFADLTDVAPLTGQAGKYVVVNQTSDGLIYADAPSGGGSDKVGVPTDGSYTDGQFPWVAGTTKVADAFDDLNELAKAQAIMLNKLIPNGPPDLSTKALTMVGGSTSRNGISFLLANNTPVNDPTLMSPPAFGSPVTRFGAAAQTTNNLGSFGDASQGTLTAKQNGSVVGSKALTTGVDSGTYGSLVILSETDYPSDRPGFWTALDAKISATGLLQGVNRLELNHSISGNATPVIVVYDAVSALPVASAFTVAQGTPGTLLFSSGVPHYQSGATLTAQATVSNLSGSTYLAQNIIQYTTSPNIGGLNINPGQYGIPTILDFVANPITPAPAMITLSGTAATRSVLQVRGSNPAIDGNILADTHQINYMNGAPTTGVIESGVAMSGSTLKRVAMGTGSNPADAPASFAAATFNSGTVPGGGSAMNTWEGIISGGVLRCDQTNYTTFLPAGPDYTGRPPTQYATFVIQKVASNMSFTFTGTDPHEVWVKLPGIPQATPNATNGWWDANNPADFAPGRWPGDTTAGNGCLVSKSGQTYNVTFGSASSAGATDHMVFIRVTLTAGQVISNIQVTI